MLAFPGVTRVATVIWWFAWWIRGGLILIWQSAGTVTRMPQSSTWLLQQQSSGFLHGNGSDSKEASTDVQMLTNLCLPSVTSARCLGQRKS